MKLCSWWWIKHLVKIQSTQRENLRLQHTLIPSHLPHEQLMLASSKEWSYKNSMAFLYIWTTIIHIQNIKIENKRRKHKKFITLSSFTIKTSFCTILQFLSYIANNPFARVLTIDMLTINCKEKNKKSVQD